MQNIPYQGLAYHVQVLTWRFIGNNWEFICERDNKQKSSIKYLDRLCTRYQIFFLNFIIFSLKCSSDNSLSPVILLKFELSSKNAKNGGPAEIWTRIAGFRVLSANRYTTGPL